jgi:hypothetical protein
MSRSNAGSILISPTENETVFRLLNERVQSLTAAVVQLVTSSPGSRSWTLVVTGVACFVKDWNRKGFFIQVNKSLGLHCKLGNCDRFYFTFEFKY